MSEAKDATIQQWGTPDASSEDVRRRMRVTRQTGTDPELLLRAALDAVGLSYDVDRSPIPGMRSRADVLFPLEHVAVFVDGCFWHGCPVHGTMPKTNRTWWEEKLAANRERDARVTRALQEAGWLALRFWSHQDARDVAQVVAERVMERRESGANGCGP